MFGIIDQIIQKIQSLQILICSLLQVKHLVIIQEKDNGVKIVLSYCLQQYVGVELYIYDPNIEAISFTIGQG